VSIVTHKYRLQYKSSRWKVAQHSSIQQVPTSAHCIGLQKWALLTSYKILVWRDKFSQWRFMTSQCRLYIVDMPVLINSSLVRPADHVRLVVGTGSFNVETFVGTHSVHYPILIQYPLLAWITTVLHHSKLFPFNWNLITYTTINI